MREAMEGDLGMSTTTKKKSAMIVVTIALVAALAVTGTLMDYFSESGGGVIWQQTGNLGISLHSYDGEKYVPVSTDPEFVPIIPGKYQSKMFSVKFAEDSSDSYLRVKVTVAGYLNHPNSYDYFVFKNTDGMGDEELAAYNKKRADYFSRFAALIYTAKHGFFFPNVTGSDGQPVVDDVTSRTKPIAWFEFDPNETQSTNISNILAGQNSSTVEVDKGSGEKESISVAPYSVSFDGYIYYGGDGDANTADQKKLGAHAPQHEGYLTILSGYKLPAFLTKTDFLTTWDSINDKSFAKFAGDGEGSVLWNQLFDLPSKMSTNADEISVADQPKQELSQYISADRYPLTGGYYNFYFKFTAQAIDSASSGNISEKSAKEVFTETESFN
jgi:hypothetical protein